MSSKITVTAVEDSTDGTVTAKAKVTDANVDAVTFLINGRKAEVGGSTVIPLSNGEASIVVDNRLLESETGAMNTIEVLGLKGNNYVTNAMNFTNIVTTYVVVPEVLSGTITVTSSREGNVSYPGDTLTAAVGEDTNNTGELSYQWYAGETAIADATNVDYVLTESEIGKTVSVKAVSTVETGYIQGEYTGDILEQSEPGPGPGPETPAGLTGTVTVSSARSGGISYPQDTLTATVSQDNNTGILNYQWYADNVKIAGATNKSYILTVSDIGKKMMVEVTSTVETGKISGTYAGKVEAQPAQPIKAASISLSAKSKKIYPYQNLQMKVTIKPSGASQQVVYSVDKKSVAAISKTGKLTAKAPGKVKVAVRTTDGSNLRATFTVTVQKPVIKVKGKLSVRMKKSITLTAKPYGLKGKVKWKLDARGKKLLKLNKTKGNKVKLTARDKTGTAKLTISCGKKKVTKKIRVKK